MPEIQARSDLVLSQAEVESNRWRHEMERLRLFPSFVLLRSDGAIVAAEGALDTSYRNSYQIRIELNRYPFSLPKVRPKGWSVHPQVSHSFSDGSICIMRSDQWRRNFTVALVVSKTAIWLNKYELWKRNGHRWPGLGQDH